MIHRDLKMFHIMKFDTKKKWFNQLNLIKSIRNIVELSIHVQ